MISLLRKVRKKLLREGSLGTYLAYAIGEIALIILGILAALWIDGSNQQRREAEQEQFYLMGLRDEFQASLDKLDTLIAVNRKTYLSTKELIVRIPQASSREEEKELSKRLITALSYEIEYNPNNGLLREILNAGRLQILSDPELRKLLMSWEPSLEQVNRQESNLRNMRESVMNVILGPDGSILTIMQDAGIARLYLGDELPESRHSNLDLLKSREFENKLVLFQVNAQSTESNFYLPLKKEVILAILERIDQSLEILD